MLSGDEYRGRNWSVRVWIKGYHERSETFVGVGRGLPVEVCGEVKGYPIIGPPDYNSIPPETCSVQSVLLQACRYGEECMARYHDMTR
jgi:hypothetical protein